MGPQEPVGIERRINDDYLMMFLTFDDFMMISA